MDSRLTTRWCAASSADTAFLADCERLFNALRHPAFYQHSHWLRAIDRHLLGGTLHLGLVRDAAGHPMLLLPTTVSGATARLPAHAHLSLADVLVHPALEPAFEPGHDSTGDSTRLDAAFISALDALAPRWGCWRGLNMPDASPLAMLAARGGDWQRVHGRDSACFALGGESTPIGGKLRRNLRRLHRQLAEHGELESRLLLPAGTDGSATAAFRAFLDIENSGWKGASADATSILSEPALADFYHALLDPAFGDIQPVVNLLNLDGEPLAAQFGLRQGSLLSLLKIGYREDYAHYSPGSLLLEQLLDAAPAEGLDKVSLVTAPAWAARWHPDTSPVWHVTRYARGMTGNATKLADAARRHLKQRLRRS